MITFNLNYFSIDLVSNIVTLGDWTSIQAKEFGGTIQFITLSSVYVGW